MEFHEKLQELRKSKGLTQEELAEALFVSRAAVSKWETGKGYPNIDSLKDISRFFSVSVDELICSEDIIILAENDKKRSITEFSAAFCFVLDILILLLLFIPVFRAYSGNDVSSSVFDLSDVQPWIKYVFIIIISMTAANGLAGVILQHIRSGLTIRIVSSGMILSAVGTMLFIMSRQPYAAIMFFLFLTVKGFLIYKAK